MPSRAPAPSLRPGTSRAAEARLLARERVGDPPAVGHGCAPGAVAALERHHDPFVDDPQAVADRLEEPPVVADDEQGGGRLPHEGLERLAGGDVEVVRRLVEEEHVRGQDPEEGQLEPRALAAGQAPHLLDDVVAAEEEAGEVPAGLACRHRDLGEERVEDRLAGERVRADLGEVAELHVGAEGEPPVAGLQLAGDDPQERRLAGAVRADDPDPLAAAGLEADDAGDVGAAGVPDDEVLDAQDHLAGTGRRARRGPGRGGASGPTRGTSIRSRRASRASCSCIFPCLRWLRYVWTRSRSLRDLAVPHVSASRRRRASRSSRCRAYAE